MQPSILPYVTLTTQEALKLTLCDLWVVSIRNWIAPWEKCHDIVFINEAEKSEGGILLLHNQLKNYLPLNKILPCL